jgi:hypothetical protein
MATLSSVAPSATAPIPAEESATLVDSSAIDKTSAVASSNQIFEERISAKELASAILHGAIFGGAVCAVMLTATAVATALKTISVFAAVIGSITVSFSGLYIVLLCASLYSLPRYSELPSSINQSAKEE